MMGFSMGTSPKISKHPLIKIFVLWIFLLGTFAACAASPPVGIPAPVSNLVNGAVGASGDATITGQDGAVNSGATVEATNVTQTGLKQDLKNLIIKQAFAGSGIPIFTARTVADDNGAFSLTLTAGPGDVIEVTQTVDGETSAPLVITLTGNTVALGLEGRDLEIDPNNSLINVAVVNGEGSLLQLSPTGTTP